jgi:hypothetical protein
VANRAGVGGGKKPFRGKLGEYFHAASEDAVPDHNYVGAPNEDRKRLFTQSREGRSEEGKKLLNADFRLDSSFSISICITPRLCGEYPDLTVQNRPCSVGFVAVGPCNR